MIIDRDFNDKQKPKTDYGMLIVLSAAIVTLTKLAGYQTLASDLQDRTNYWLDMRDEDGK